jgi:hypothetical protein
LPSRDGKLHGVQPKAHEALGDFAAAFNITTDDIEAAIALAKRSASPSIPRWPRSHARRLTPPPENHHADHRHAGGR